MPVTLVTGGAGYVGRFIVEGLLGAGHEIVVAGRTRPPDGFFSEPVKFVPASLEPGEIDEAIFENVDFVVHAAFDHVPGKYRGGEGDDPGGFVWRNLHGSTALFRAARAAGAKRLVFLSSRAVYGPRPPGTTLSEEMDPNPDTLYGRVKLDAERALLEPADDSSQPIVLRITGVYGPAGAGREDKWTPMIRDWLAGRAIEPRAGTEVHGKDVAAAVELLLSAPTEALRDVVFNVSDMVVDRRELLSIVKRLTGASCPLPAPADKMAVNVMRTDRLYRLGWRPGGKRLFENTIEDLLARFSD